MVNTGSELGTFIKKIQADS